MGDQVLLREEVLLLLGCASDQGRGQVSLYRLP